MRDRPILAALAVAAAVASGGLALILVTGNPQRDERLWLEIGKGLIQLLVVVLFGAAVKFLVDRYQDRQLRAEQRREFRRDKYERLVEATNCLRRVPVLIEANRSVAIWNEQMLVVLDTGLTLRTMKHQISLSGDLGDLPFPNSAELVFLFELMYRYTDWVAADFAANKEELTRRQLQADGHGPWAAWRARRQETVWNRIQMLDAVADLRRTVNVRDREACRDAIRDEMTAVVSQAPMQSDRPSDRWWQRHRSWLAYQEAHALALEEISRATLGGARRRREGRRRAIVADVLVAPL